MIKYRLRAQALVEFALVIVLLLMIVLGLLEVARLLFVYGAVVTSSREAVRYGSVAGINDAGNLYYQDCAGIRNTARRLAFFQDLGDDDILIQYESVVYDAGTDQYITTIIDQCDGVLDLGVNPAQGDRIRVTITASFTAIVPLVVPISNMAIDSTSARTIMGIIILE